MSDIDAKNEGLKWYVAHTYTGYENKVKTSLEKLVENRGLSHLIKEVVIPVEQVITKKGENEIVKEEKLFPSYVYIHMVMNDESWHAVRNITGVTGFVGPGSRPFPLSDSEVEALNIEGKRIKLTFAVGEEVELVGGLFAGYTGKVQSISEDSSKVTVLVQKGRRDMTVEADVGDVKSKNA